MKLARGALLDGRYELTALLGEGGMGRVFEARDRVTNALVAVKVLRAPARRDPTLAARFQREGEILARVRSPHVCRAFAASVDEASGTPFLVMERLYGDVLAGVLRRGRAFPLTWVAPLLERMLTGLVAVHAAGIVHRDLKPQNVFLAEDGATRRVVLIDFGIAKLSDGLGVGLTSDAVTLGSPRYMAPEQLGSARDASDRCDVYAAATIAFRALTGQLPFGDDGKDLLVLKRSYDAPSLRDATDQAWPDPLEAFFAAALARDPAARPAAHDALATWRRAAEEAAGAPGGLPTIASRDDAARDAVDETPPLSR